MKRPSITLLILSSLCLLGAACLTTHAIAESSASSNLHMTHKNLPTMPSPGIIEGTVIATSSTSITINERTYRHKTASSTEETFLMIPDVRIDVDQSEHASSSMSSISAGSSVSLVLEHIGKDAGEVREIRLQPTVERKAHTQ